MLQNQENQSVRQALTGMIDTYQPGLTSTNSLGSGLVMNTDPIPGLSQLPKSISINPVNYGFIVSVGCQTFAIDSVDKLILKLAEYLKNPTEMEKKWLTTGKLFD